MHVSDFDYDLPEELIAQQPLPERDASRMLIVNRQTAGWTDSEFKTLPDYLSEGDAVVINNTRVFPARLRGTRIPSGGQIEILLIREVAQCTWEALARPARRLKTGSEVMFSADLRALVIDSLPNGVRVIRFDGEAEVATLIDQLGEPPLPPYIRREPDHRHADRERYQTVYASHRGAIAAPTAGLHFTPEVIDGIKRRGAEIVEITLHVGYGTFEPVKVTEVDKHQVAAEWFSISPEAANRINATRQSSRKILAVGTTTTRALESAVSADGQLKAQTGQATLTILPGHQFRVVDELLTNFHLPKSSLLILVSAFAGRELILKAYQHAVARKYRFYSYGDCMLIR